MTKFFSNLIKLIEILSCLTSIAVIFFIWPWRLDLQILDVTPVTIKRADDAKGISFILHVKNNSWRAIRLTNERIAGKKTTLFCISRTPDETVQHFKEKMNKYFDKINQPPFVRISTQGWLRNEREDVIEPGDEKFIWIEFINSLNLGSGSSRVILATGEQHPETEFIDGFSNCCYSDAYPCQPRSNIDYYDIWEYEPGTGLTNDWKDNKLQLSITIGPKYPIGNLGQKTITVEYNKFNDPISVLNSEIEDVTVQELIFRNFNNGYLEEPPPYIPLQSSSTNYPVSPVSTFSTP
jgi:hypothetical protein